MLFECSRLPELHPDFPESLYIYQFQNLRVHFLGDTQFQLAKEKREVDSGSSAVWYFWDILAVGKRNRSQI